MEWTHQGPWGRQGFAGMTATRRRDWFRILRDLVAAGVSMSKVARKCNRDKGTIAGWADGGEPKESDARIVLALYAKHCPEKYADHARQFDIRVEIEAVTDVGETRGLPFLG